MKRYTHQEATNAAAVAMQEFSFSLRGRVFERGQKYGGGFGFILEADSIRVSSQSPDSFRVSIYGVQTDGNISAHGYEGRGSTLAEAIEDCTAPARREAEHIIKIVTQLTK